MLFNTYIFILLFLPFTLAGYYFCGRKYGHRFALCWLILMSLAFYSWWNAWFLLLVLISLGINYIIGRQMVLYNNRQSPAKNYLILGIFFNLGLLGIFKFFNFFVDGINRLFSTDVHFMALILPLGISFYTLTQVSYLVDLYREKRTKHYRFSSYFLFVVYFPYLMAGPILNHKEMMPQFDDPQIIKFNSKSFAIGLSVFALALFKKVIIADYFAGITAPLFAASQTGSVLTFFESWIAAVSYTFQLYFDFSAYSEMAIGLSLMLNIIMPANFFSPYKAMSIRQFWHRWHISLSRFLRDYLYIPLGGNRKGKQRQRLNILVTMLIGGLWHGASLTFVLWGGIHGMLLVINHWCSGWKCRRIPLLSWAVTFFIIVNTWVMFRAESLPSALRIYSSMYNLTNIGLPMRFEGVPFIASLPFFSFDGIYQNITVISSQYLAMIAIAAVIVFWMPNLYQLFKGENIAFLTYRDNIRVLSAPVPIRWRNSAAWALIVGLLFALAFASLGRITDFLYMHF